jgi:5'(3')-deoxyribonucleotidase
MDTRFVLGVDLDGVVADFYGAMRIIAAEWLGVELDALPTEVSYGLPEWDLTPERYEDMHRFAVTQRHLFREMPPIDGAPSALRRLSDAEIHIRIVTHRFFIPYFHQEAGKQTIEWLDHWGIPYRDLCFAADKVAVGADLYIEDSPHNVVALRSITPTIVFANSTNRQIGGLRAENWTEAERLIRSQVDEWRRNPPDNGTDVTGR